MKILLLGHGYVGSAFEKELIRRRIPVVSPTKPCRDLTFLNILELIERNSVELIINAAACVKTPSVDCNEDFKSETLIANTVFPGMVANACEVREIPLIQVSTGCLYQGDKDGNGWTEEDPPQVTMDTGAGIYVSSKVIAEQVVCQYVKAYICRIRLPFDNEDNPRNLLSKLSRFSTIVDETQSITHRWDFVNACLELWDKRAPFGIYNCSNAGGVDYRWICDQINKFLFDGKREFKFITPEEFDRTAARTVKTRCVSSVAKLISAVGYMRNVNDAVVHSLENWRKA